MTRSAWATPNAGATSVTAEPSNNTTDTFPAVPTHNPLVAGKTAESLGETVTARTNGPTNWDTDVDIRHKY